MKVQTDRKLADANNRLAAWKLEISSLTSAKSSVQSLQPPDSGAVDKLSQTPATDGIPALKNDIQSVANSIQVLYSRATPTSFGSPFASAGNIQTDPEVAAFNSEWNAKISTLQSNLNLPSMFSLYQIGQGSASPKELADIASALKPKATPDAFKQDRDSVVSTLDELIQEATTVRDKVEKEADSLQATSDSIVAKQGKAKTEINELAIELGLPLFCVTVLLMLSIPIVVQSFSRAAGSSEQVRAIFSSGILVEIITVLLLTMSILILGLSGKIEGPVLGTLLGGISGYVLNRFRGKNQGDPVDQGQGTKDSQSQGQQTSH